MRARLLTITGLVILSLLTAISEADQPSSKASNVVPVYQPKHYPFDGGERLVYHASWNGLFSVATATVHTTSEWVDGQKFYNVRVEASSSKLLDFIWKMRDTITSKIDANGLTPTRFTFSQRENRKSLIPSRVLTGPRKHGRCIEMSERRLNAISSINRTIRST